MSTMNIMHGAFVTCPKGLEGLLLAEVGTLGAENAKETVAGVSLTGTLACLYRICLESRLANRVLLRLEEFGVAGDDDLYAGVREVRWREHFRPDTTFAIDFSGTSDEIRNSHYGAQRTKDAIVDHFRDHGGRRPSVDTRRTGIRVNVRLHRGRAAVSLDLAGDSLHRRGYREAGGAAPLKENLAGALLLRAGWPAVAAAGGALVDPLCGSAVLLIEGALMAAGIAPGLLRRRWGFEGWLGHAPEIWRDILDAARARRDGAEAAEWPEIIGYDASGHAVQMAERNIAGAGLTGRIRVRRKELAGLVRPSHHPLPYGLVITNPPYGERIGDEASLVHLYRFLGAKLKSEFRGWQGAMITGNPALGKTMGLKAVKQYRFFNGPIPCRLLLFDIRPERFVGESGERAASGDATAPVLGKGAQMLANRLRKNARRLRKWVRDNRISCYRLYDADMPEYAVSIDVYADSVHVAEYRAPDTVDPAAAEQHLRDVVLAVSAMLEIPAGRVAIKQRRRQHGREQYRKRAARGEFLEVEEGRVKLLVNLHDYLDTGLFLDHRRLRLELGEAARGKRFLNLFCYTGAATVHAAAGGARFSTSVDLSSTYLDWARRNLAVNGIAETRHRLVRANAIEWLEENRDRYDLILLDPPTFSNSKRMPAHFDVQRDHAGLIAKAGERLAADGLLVFSTNRRKFDLDPSLGSNWRVEEVTSRTLDRDFTGSKHAHRCWFVRRVTDAA